MSYAQDQIENTVQTAQQLLNCRNLKDMADVHAQYMQQSFDRLVTEANKATHSAAKFAKETVEPLQAKMDNFVSGIKGTA